MAGSLNKVTLIGRLGGDPEKRSFSNGGQVVSFSLATSETWKDRSSGERQERTEWHRIAIFTEGLGDVVEQYARKGALVYVEGKLETRKWQDTHGQDRYSTEIVLRPFVGTFTFLSDPPASGDREPRGQSGAPAGGGTRARGRQRAPATAGQDMDDDVPF
ncbi:single-stranded DNA-binding protein [Roseomonas mucosa]|uniref:Single-stranded DNA-binding protein n=4 Tax=Roseomonas TaxID=125216 RepID=A0A379PLA3_9PROT|nr:single-stranded DNA-binding protein [Roseomonas mucosa]MBS5905568.1 single-stranded DNA-binding protein [Acetobacteraceae bacterium]MCG7359190.1 single-stranded DNA-binding protein [Roseomonas mucosa]MDT8292252.1 single-stranded DNA-binding protein [Roseomonas mucosa]MDT8296273.1 single-stranded DNA-binding protein [Roseomonas mucosa]MDT8352489.1 single-stranded DNA-binding protein [Roseomonas mucosa]